METKKIIISVPGCIGNIGSGFDCMGMSLRIFNRFTFELSDSFYITTSASGIETDKKNLCFQSFDKTCQFFGEKTPSVRIKIEVSIPPGAGLGSSSTAIIAGIVAAFVFTNRNIEPSIVFKLGKEFEDHLDNIAASFLGGLVVVAEHNSKIVWKKFRIPSDLNAIFFISNEPFLTKKARNILPEKIPLQDAVFNLPRVCFLPVALKEKNKDLLAVATCDKLHQPYRNSLYPHFEVLYESAMEAGAAGCCLSGAGPSVVSFSFECSDKIIKKWQHVIKEKNLNGKIKVIKLGGRTKWKVC